MLDRQDAGTGRVDGRGRALLAAGGALLVVSPVLTWITISNVGHYDLSGLLKASDSSRIFAYLLALAGIGFIAHAFLATSLHRMRVVAIVVGIFGSVTGAIEYISIVRAASDGHGFGRPGLGFLLALIGAILVVVPAFAGLLTEPSPAPAQGSSGRVPLLPVPWWGPVALASTIAFTMTWMPQHNGSGYFCGSAAGSLFKDKRAIPSARPPADVEAQLQKDQAEIDRAQTAVDTKQGATSTVQQLQAQATSLLGQAKSATSDAQSASDRLAAAQSQLGDDNSAVDSDKSAVFGSQQVVDYDQNTVDAIRRSLAQDQQAGADTRADITALDIAQRTLATNQAALAAAQQQLAADQSKAAASAAAVSQAQQAADSAQARADQLAQQAGDARAKAGQKSSSATTVITAAQENLNNAKGALERDSQAWKTQYDVALTSAKAYNASISGCEDQGVFRLVLAAVILGMGAFLSFTLAATRRLRA